MTKKATTTTKATTNKAAASKPTTGKATTSKATPKQATELYPDRPGVEGYNNSAANLNHALNAASEMKSKRTKATEPQVEAKADAATKAPQKGTQAETKPAKPTSPRYEAAVKAVSEKNKLFIQCLERKAAALGTVRHNESVGIKDATPELASLNAQIAEARAHLNSLLEKKRALKPASDELKTIDQEVAAARKARNIARAEKKAAMEELTAIQ